MREYSGHWRYARFPNFYQSTVIVGDVEFHIFDTVMKRCSTDFGHETLATKWQLFQAAIAATRETLQIMS